jgi:hypothetical protein
MTQAVEDGNIAESVTPLTLQREQQFVLRVVEH